MPKEAQTFFGKLKIKTGECAAFERGVFSDRAPATKMNGIESSNPTLCYRRLRKNFMEKEKNFPFSLSVALLLLCGFLAYSNALHAPFYFDDHPNILHNSRVLNARDWIGIFNDNATRSLSHLSFAINYELGGVSPWGYHIVNLIIHLLNGIFVFAITRFLMMTPAFRTRPPFSAPENLIAFSAGLIFVCHPLQTQAVTYIVQRITSMAAFFYLATVLLYLHFRISKKRASYLLGLFTALLGILSKEIAFTLPAALLLCEIFFFAPSRETAWQLVKRLLPFALISLLIPGLLFLNQHDIIENGGQMALVPTMAKNIPRGIYFITQLDVIRTYLRLLILPVRQTFDYDFPFSAGFFTPATFGSFILLMAVFALGFRLIRRQPLASFGIFFFFLALSVDSSIIPLPDLIFEHRLYLSVAGFSFLAASCLAQFLRSSKIFGAVLILLAFGLGALTYQRNGVWADELAFWKDQVQKAPLKGRGYFGLGETYHKKGQHQLAADSFLSALRWTPPEERKDVYFNNLGSSYAGLGQISTAEYWYRKGLEAYPKSGILYTNLAVLKRKEGDLENAAQLLKKAVALAPDISIAYYELAQIHVIRKEYPQAVSLLEKAIAVDPFLPPARVLLANVHALQKNKGHEMEKHDTIDTLKESIRTNPTDPSLPIRLGEFYRKAGQEDAAIAAFRKAIVLAPSSREGYDALALFHKERGDKQKALAVLVEYLKYKKEHKPLFGNLKSRETVLGERNP
jgi:tetratricopeptide (TPR) repeat protein